MMVKHWKNVFDVGETSITVNNMRESQRVKKRRDRDEYAAATQRNENEASISIDRQDITRQEMMGNVIPEKSKCLHPKVQDNEASLIMDNGRWLKHSNSAYYPQTTPFWYKMCRSSRHYQAFVVA
jgi:hypothetical protein